MTTEIIEVNELGGRQSLLPVRCDLLPADATLEVCRVLRAGAEKYGDDNWKAIDVRSHLNHLMKHVLSYLAGDDSEDHLSNAACRALMALEIEINGVQPMPSNDDYLEPEYGGSE